MPEMQSATTRTCPAVFLARAMAVRQPRGLGRVRVDSSKRGYFAGRLTVKTLRDSPCDLGNL